MADVDDGKKFANSEERLKALIEADWRYRAFYDALLMSPSYMNAAYIVANGLNWADYRLPADFPEVMTTFQMFGDAIDKLFYDWWIDIAQHQFDLEPPLEPQILLNLEHYQQPTNEELEDVDKNVRTYLKRDRPAQGNSAALIIALPIWSDRASTIMLFTKALQSMPDLFKRKPTKGKFAFIKNKIRRNTFKTAISVLKEHAKNPDLKLFEIGNRLNLSPSNWTDPQESRAATGKKREMMEIITSRHLHRAYLFCENAARGRFPSLDPLPPDTKRPDFDFDRINCLENSEHLLSRIRHIELLMDIMKESTSAEFQADLSQMEQSDQRELVEQLVNIILKNHEVAMDLAEPDELVDGNGKHLELLKKMGFVSNT